MASMNWNKCRKPGVSYSHKRVTALKMERLEEVPATEKQLAFMRSLGLEFPKQVTKRQARSLISQELEKRSVV